MAEFMPDLPEDLEPDVSHLVTEDDEPVDSIFTEKQERLLTEPLYTSWQDVERFLAFANVGLFASPYEPPVVPDVMLSLDVVLPDDIHKKRNRTYFVWRYGKPPDVVIEIVSNRVGGEEAKLQRYARIGVAYAVIFDPEHHLGQRVLRGYTRHGLHYVDLLDVSYLPEIGLGLTLWEGEYEGRRETWLRWCDGEGRLLPTGAEASAAARHDADAARQDADAARQDADVARQDADAARQEADAARQEAERERARAAAMASRLRELGMEP